MLASVVIPTRNRGAGLEQIIRSLGAQSVGPDRLEIVVVDNASTDDTAQRLAALAERSAVPLRWHRVDVDRGPASARNVGARLARGTAIVFLDSDVELDSRWIEIATRYLAEHRETGLVAGKLLYARRRDRVNMFGGELSRLGLAWDADEGAVSADAIAPRERLWAPSAALLVRRELIDRVGLFDDTFYFGFEDSDFGWRANLAGFRCVCLPDLVALHHSTPSSRTAGAEIVFHYSKNRLRSLLKNYSPASLATYLPLYLAYSAVEVCVRPDRAARVRALAWNMRWLPDTWRHRRRVQQLRRRQDTELVPYFSRRLWPARTLARRRADEGRLLEQAR